MAPIMPILEEQGYYEMTMSWGKSETTGRVTQADVRRRIDLVRLVCSLSCPQIDEYATWPIDQTLASLPAVSFLTLSESHAT